MPNPAPTPAAPAAVPAAPETPPSSPVAPPVAATPAAPAADPQGKERGKRIWNLLQEETDSKPGEKKEPKTAPKPAETPPAEPAAPAAPAEGLIKAAKKPAISKRPEPPPPVAATPAAPVAPAPSPKTDEEWEAALVEGEKQLLADAEEAEKHLPARKGLKEQAKKFIRAHQEYLDKHPEIDTDDDEKAAYDKWLGRNRPALSEAEQRTVSENRIAAKISQPLQRDADDLRHQLFVRDEEPKLQQQSAQLRSKLNGEAMPKEILEFAQKHGNEAAIKQYADEIKLHNVVVNTALSDYQEMMRLSTRHPVSGRPLAVEVTDPKTDPEKFAQHQRLGNWVGIISDDFKERAKEGELVRDGKWFVTRDEWNKMYKQYPDRYWTFNNKEIAERMLGWVKPAVENAIKRNREEMAARGYERRAYTSPATAPAAVPARPTSSAPGPGTSPVPPPNSPQPPANTPGARLASALSGG